MLLLATVLVAVMFAGCGGSKRTASAVSTTTQSPSSTTSTSSTVSRHHLRHHRSNSSTAGSSKRVQPSSPLAGRTVVVDPGHNGGNAAHPDVINQLVNAGRGRTKPCNTTGTSTDSGFPEATFNFLVALDLRRLLRSAGARVVMTRTTNDSVGPCVDQRAQIGNAAHADAVIAIHADGAASGGRGFHVIYPPPVGDTAPIYDSSLALAHAVHDALASSGVLPESTYLGHNGYDQRDDLAGLNLSTRPAIFVELGNMRNPIDAALQQSSAGRAQIARALFAGLTRFLKSAR